MTGFLVKSEIKVNRFNAVSLIPAVICISVWGVLCSSVGISCVVPAAMSLIALYPLICKGKKQFYTVSAVLFAAAFIFLLTQINGMEVLMNKVFSESEKVQSYEYVYFAVDGNNGITALAAMSVLYAVVCGFVSRYCCATAAAVTLVLVIAFLAYFGIAASPMWMLILFAVVLLSAVREITPGRAAAILLAVVVTGGLCVLLSPNNFGQTAALNEKLRDTLAVNFVSNTEIVEELPEQTPSPTPAPSFAERIKYLNINPNGWTKTHTLICIIAATLLVLFIPAVINDRYNKRVSRNRMGLQDKNNAAAVKAMFLYALKWLEIGGYSRNNLPLLESAYSLPENMRSEFCNALNIWQEAVYSVHDIDNEKRETVRQFADECRDYALSDKKAIQKLRIKYKYAL